MSTKEDNIYMQRALQLALCGEAAAAPNPMVGAVIVADGRIIGEGWHRKCGGPHAEVNAVNSVSERDLPLLRKSTIYVTLEPCAHWGKTPPCADMIVERGIPRIVIGCKDPFAKVDGLGIQKLKDAGREVIAQPRFYDFSSAPPPLRDAEMGPTSRRQHGGTDLNAFHPHARSQIESAVRSNTRGDEHDAHRPSVAHGARLAD